MLVVGPRAVRYSAGGIALLLVLGVMATGVVSYVAADRLVHPTREHHLATPAQRGLAYEPISLRTEDGLKLAGWWIPANDAIGTVVFLHGYGASKSQVLPLAGFLVRAGYNVLAFDFRAHGESEGSHTTIGIEEAKDVATAVMYVIAREGATARIALFGWSMGAASALNAADDLPPQVQGVILDSGFARLANVVSGSLAQFTGLPEYPFGPTTLAFASFMAGHRPEENEPSRHASALQRPMLVIQGTKDRIAGEQDGRAIAESAGSYADLWLVPGVGHVDARRADPREYEARVLAFLGQHLSAT